MLHGGDYVRLYGNKMWLVGTLQFVDFVTECLDILEKFDECGYEMVMDSFVSLG